MIGELCFAKSFDTEVFLAVDVFKTVHAVSHEEVVDTGIDTGIRGISLLDVNAESVGIKPLTDSEGDYFAS